MRLTSLFIMAAAPLLIVSAAEAQTPRPAAGTDHHLLHRAADIEWKAGPGSLEPGAEFAVLEGNPAEPGIFTMRIRMPDGYHIAPHWHPKPERVTVISGTFRLGAGEVMNVDDTTPLGPGSYTSLPPGMRHFAVTQGETVIQLTSVGPWEITYVRPQDDPRGRD